MVKLAILVLLLMCTAAFASPTFLPGTNEGPSSVPVSEIEESGTMVDITDAAVDGEINREKETGLSSEELADD